MRLGIKSLDPARCQRDDIADHTGFNFHQCLRKPWRDGWCRQHHPETIAARDQARHKRWERERERAPDKRIAALEADLARERQRAEKAERERDLALAHDTQPYPTADAYEKVCAALEKQKRLLGEAEEAIRFADLIFVEESMRSTAFAELSFSNWIEHPAVRRALGQAEGEEREG